MVKLILGDHDVFSGELSTYTVSTFGVRFKFQSGAEINIENVSEEMKVKLKSIGLRNMVNSEANFNTGMVNIIHVNNNRDATLGNLPRVNVATGITQEPQGNIGKLSDHEYATLKQGRLPKKTVGTDASVIDDSLKIDTTEL